MRRYLLTHLVWERHAIIVEIARSMENRSRIHVCLEIELQNKMLRDITFQRIYCLCRQFY